MADPPPLEITNRHPRRGPSAFVARFEPLLLEVPIVSFPHRPSPEAVPALQTDEPAAAEECDGNSSVFPKMNPYLDLWLEAVASDGTLPSEASAVASAMSRSVGIGRVSFTNWQRINTALGRNRRDLAVFEIMSELELGGYLDRNVNDRFGWPYGWSLLIPEAGL